MDPGAVRGGLAAVPGRPSRHHARTVADVHGPALTRHRGDGRRYRRRDLGGDQLRAVGRIESHQVDDLGWVRHRGPAARAHRLRAGHRDLRRPLEPVPAGRRPGVDGSSDGRHPAVLRRLDRRVRGGAAAAPLGTRLARMGTRRARRGHRRQRLAQHAWWPAASRLAADQHHQGPADGAGLDAGGPCLSRAPGRGAVGAHQHDSGGGGVGHAGWSPRAGLLGAGRPTRRGDLVDGTRRGADAHTAWAALGGGAGAGRRPAC